MANVKLFPFLLVLAVLIVTALVKANPVPQSLVARVSNATCPDNDTDDCCILDFTISPCIDHTAPNCGSNGCGPVSQPIGFSYAGLAGSSPCVNVLDPNGNPSTYDQFWISWCSRYVDSIELYSANDCDGTYWNQINTAGCYHNGGRIGSFRILPVPDHKRQVLSSWHENNASVTPPDDCFDKEIGAYILDCKVERGELHTGSPSLSALGGPPYNTPASGLSPVPNGPFATGNPTGVPNSVPKISHTHTHTRVEAPTKVTTKNNVVPNGPGTAKVIV